MKPAHDLLPTMLVGSYAQPDWLIDREKLAGRFPPRVRALELWRVEPEYLEQAQDDATILTIRDQERDGIDILTDQEMRRESYSNRFATALEGVNIDNPGSALDRPGHANPVPRSCARSCRVRPVRMTGLTYVLGVLVLIAALLAPPPSHAADPFTLDAVRAQVKQDFAQVPQLSTADLARAMAGKDNLLVLDVRESQEFAVSRIAGAQRVDPGIWRWNFMRQFGDMAKGKTVVFYCAVGVRSSRLAATVQAALKEQGAKAVYNLDGGVFAWHNETRALVNGAGATDFVHPFDKYWGRLVERKELTRTTP